jgi:hypothetical protein
MKFPRSQTLAILILLLFTQSCNAPWIGRSAQSRPSGDEQAQPADIPLAPEDLEPGTTFLLVVDPSGNPIPNAQAGDSDLFTNRDGVAVGKVTTNAEGWFPVFASGFATKYSKAFTEWNGHPIVLTILTPLGPAAIVDSGSTTTLTVENIRREQARVTISPSDFDEQQVLLSWSNIPLTQLDVRFADTSGLDDQLLWGAFILEASNPEGHFLDVGDGGEITLQIEWDMERSEIPSVGSFNPETSAWELLSERCQLDETGLMTCKLSHLSEFGFFGHSSGGEGWDEDDGTDDDIFSGGFGSSLDNALGGGAGGFAAGGGTSDEDDEGGVVGGGLEGGLDGLTNSGDGLGSEVDKMTALIAAGLAIDNGLNSLANQYLDQAREAIKDMAENLLKDPSCGKVYEMLTVASQAWLVGGIDSLGNQLVDRATEIFERCGVWYGTIHYTFELQDTWPHAKKWEHESGAQTWTEVHDVRIYVDPKSGVIDGESHVHLAFSTATYRHERTSVCGPIHNDHEADTDPSDGNAVLLFEGTFDGKTFQIGELRVDNNKPINLQHHAWYSRTFADPVAPPPSCPPVITEEISTQTIAEYTSQLIHGFFGQPEPPSLQEMLNSDDRRYDSSERVISISGRKDLAYDVGSNLSPLLPVEKGLVRWHFYRVSGGSK